MIAVTRTADGKGPTRIDDDVDLRIQHLQNWLAAFVNSDQHLRSDERPALMAFLATLSRAYEVFRRDKVQMENARKAAFWDALTTADDPPDTGTVVALYERYHLGLLPGGRDADKG